jgi:hypothetical protein
MDAQRTHTTSGIRTERNLVDLKIVLTSQDGRCRLQTRTWRVSNREFWRESSVPYTLVLVIAMETLFLQTVSQHRLGSLVAHAHGQVDMTNLCDHSIKYTPFPMSLSTCGN